MIKRR